MNESQPWRLLVHPGLSGPAQMAIDESLFECLNPGSSPILRFYSWNAPTLSLGRFQDYKKVVAEAFCVHNNIDVVRRLTGGRAVLHHLEATYAVAAPLDRGFFRGHSLQQTYRRIAAALNRGLEMMGVQRALIAVDAPAQHPLRGGGQCFVSVSKYEIAENARKIIGSAQRRASDRFLQHGSILLDFDAALQSGCVNHSDPEIESKIAPLCRLLGRRLSFEEITRTFTSAFEQTLEIEFIDSQLNTQEERRVKELEAVYAADGWTRNGCR
jgi:lipoate-protein ligase A